MEIQLPFSGFYNSLHESNIDDALDQEFSDDYGDINYELLQQASDLIDWRVVHLAYVQEYCDNWKEKTKINVSFVKMESPKFYNYSTDKIICEIDDSEIVRIFNECDKVILAALIKERCTSYDGFISFFSPKLTDWPENVLDWKEPQIDLLIESYASEYLNNDDYTYLMDNARAQGLFQEWFFDGAKINNNVDKLNALYEQIK